ncbi:MAG: tetratricopeptide repeat protein [Pseudomonadota bacterium]
MRNEYYDDREQGEAVKQWLKTNGMSIVTGIALGISALYGWRYWQSAQQTGRERAAVAYEQLIADVDGEVEATRELLDRFAGQNDNPAYATLAALTLAAKAVEDRNYAEAAELLGYAEAQGEPPALRAIAGLRRARVLIQTGQFEQASAAVDRHDGEIHKALAAELRGDIALAQGQQDAARLAYADALAAGASGDTSLLQMKHDDLAGVVAVPADDQAIEPTPEPEADSGSAPSEDNAAAAESSAPAEAMEAAEEMVDAAAAGVASETEAEDTP